MALVVFLRGVNVGGYRTFRPSLLAKALSKYDVVNVGAAGTFVVRKPGSRAKFRADLLRKLPFEAEVVLCDGRDLIRFETENPFERPGEELLLTCGRNRRSLTVQDVRGSLDALGLEPLLGGGSLEARVHAWNLRTSLAMAPGIERTRTQRPASSNVSERTRAVSYTSPMRPWLA